ncbi:MAG: M20/M25/M40 family metallo-hydrolase [Planctomycetes bacterium]|nr:M20/M25/M40 family metallo-hydrolase [Planctomycetota bacterium]
MIRRSLRLLGGLLAAAACFEAPLAAQRPLEEWIDAAGLGAHLRFLASDLLEGRGVGTRGDELAQSYLEAQFRAAGLAPGVDGQSYRQPVPLVGHTSQARSPLAIRSAGKPPLELQWLQDFVAGVDAPVATGTWKDAEIVFVGYGIEAPEQGWDDWKGVDVRGKVLLMLNDDPDWDPQLFAGKARLYYGRWTYKYEIAAAKGAAGALIVHTTPSAGYGWNVVQSSFARERFDLEGDAGPRTAIRGWVSEEAASRIAELGGAKLADLVAAARTKEFRPRPLGVTAALELTAEVRPIQSSNVCAILPGSDPSLANEWVVLSTHFDHLGRNPALEGDQIHNGAVDNASGCAGLITVARALQATGLRAKRTLCFLAVTAEESGLLGSQHFASSPPIPRERIAACLNIDSLARFGAAKDVAVIGKGKTELDADVEAIAASFGRTVVGDLEPDKGRFYRSDQFSFARVGIPAIYLGPGLNLIGEPEGEGARKVQRWTMQHYHQPSDEWSESWDLSGAVSDLRLFARLVLRVGDRAQAPQWVAGDEFERLRPRRAQ